MVSATWYVVVTSVSLNNACQIFDKAKLMQSAQQADKHGMIAMGIAVASSLALTVL